MRRNQLLSAVVILLFVAGSLAAQDKDKRGTLASIEFQKVKISNVPQYEAGRKQEGRVAQAAERPAAIICMADHQRR